MHMVDVSIGVALAMVNKRRKMYHEGHLTYYGIYLSELYRLL
jgi:hypothetical protein